MNPVFFHLAVEGPARNAEGFGRPRQMPILLLEYRPDQRGFCGRKGAAPEGKGKIAYQSFPNLLREMLGEDMPAPAENHGAFDSVRQFPHVARPGVFAKQGQGRSADSDDVSCGLPPVFFEEKINEQRDIGFARPERRGSQGHDVNPVVQVLAKDPVLDRGGQIPIRGANDPDIDPDRFGPADPLEAPQLQDPQQRNLGLHGDVADFVKENRPARGGLEKTRFPGRGPGKSPFFVAEEGAVYQLLGQGGAIDLNERLFGASAPGMNGVCDQLLARAAFAGGPPCGPRSRPCAKSL